MITKRDERLFWLLTLAYRRAASVADAGLEDLDLTAAQAGALFAVPMEGATNVNDLAAMLRIGQSAASIFAQRLEKAGLISRQTDPKDSRYALLLLTERGRAVRSEAAARARDFNAHLRADLNDEQLATVTAWLVQIINMKEEAT